MKVKPLCRGDDCSFTSVSVCGTRARLSLLEWERGKSVLWMNDFFILFVSLTLNPGLHRHTHSTSTTHPCPDVNWIHKEPPPPPPLPSSLGIVRHKPVKSVFGFVWACWIRVGLGLWSTKLYVRTLMEQLMVSSGLRNSPFNK